ncbi:unnamed protein product [Boreogadus saida]
MVMTLEKNTRDLEGGQQVAYMCQQETSRQSSSLALENCCAAKANRFHRTKHGGRTPTKVTLKYPPVSSSLALRLWVLALDPSWWRTPCSFSAGAKSLTSVQRHESQNGENQKSPPGVHRGPRLVPDVPTFVEKNARRSDPEVRLSSPPLGPHPVFMGGGSPG